MYLLGRLLGTMLSDQKGRDHSSCTTIIIVQKY